MGFRIVLLPPRDITVIWIYHNEVWQKDHYIANLILYYINHTFKSHCFLFPWVQLYTSLYRYNDGLVMSKQQFLINVDLDIQRNNPKLRKHDMMYITIK